MLLAALGAGCSQQRQPPPAEQVDKQLLAEDSRAMAQRYAQWQKSLQSHALKSRANQQMPVDLSDVVQFRFVMNRLKAAGLNDQNAPRLFARLRDISRLPKELPLANPSKTAQATTTTADAAWCGHMIPLGGAGSDEAQARFQGTGLSSCFNGSDYGFVDVNAYSTNEAQTTFELLASESHEEYAGKVLETAPVTVSLPRTTERELLVDSLAMAFDEKNGQDHITYTSVSASLHAGGAGDGDITLEHPRDLLDLVPHDKAIRLCLERGSIHGFLDCDYGTVRANPDGTYTPFVATGGTGIAAVDADASIATTSGGGTPTWIADKTAYWEPAVKPYDPARFQVPTRGVFKPHVLEECQVEKVTSKVVAILMDSGGWCEEGWTPGTVVGKGHLPWEMPTVPGEYPFNGILDFGKGNCVANAQNVRLEMWVYAEGTCPDPFGGEPEYFRCPAKKEVKPVDYKRVCMAEGTQVVNAAGERVAVEKVKVGDKLLANGNGLTLTVTTVSRGGESKPLVKLRDDQGHEVRVTDTHPMVTAKRGVVQAGDLKVGEGVVTRTGVTKLVSVERVPYQGLVYNFALGTPEELAKAGPEARTMFADGFLVGDSQTQTELEKQRRVDAREVLAKLHGAWHEDYRHSQQRRARK
jgi:hypothetical protein